MTSLRPSSATGMTLKHLSQVSIVNVTTTSCGEERRARWQVPGRSGPHPCFEHRRARLVDEDDALLPALSVEDIDFATMKV